MIPGHDLQVPGHVMYMICHRIIRAWLPGHQAEMQTQSFDSNTFCQMLPWHCRLQSQVWAELCFIALES